jgi:uncharacterized membrane protein
MTSWRDRFNRLGGKTRFVVCRIFLHLAGDQVAPLLGVLNSVAQAAIDAEGDMQVLGEGLEEICQSLLRYDTYWQAAANEGEVFWDEGEAADFINQIFTDSGQRYKASPDLELEDIPQDSLSIPITNNLVVLLTVAYEGESPELESNLADINALKKGLAALINLHYSEALRAVQVHYSPAQLGDELTTDQIVLNFPELVPL